MYIISAYHQNIKNKSDIKYIVEYLSTYLLSIYHNFLVQRIIPLYRNCVYMCICYKTPPYIPTKHRVQNLGCGSLVWVRWQWGGLSLLAFALRIIHFPVNCWTAERTPTGVSESARAPACAGSSHLAEHELCSFSEQAQLSWEWRGSCKSVSWCSFLNTFLNVLNNGWAPGPFFMKASSSSFWNMKKLFGPLETIPGISPIPQDYHLITIHSRTANGLPNGSCCSISSSGCF